MAKLLGVTLDCKVSVSICFDHDSLQSSVTPSCLVISTCSISTLCITIFSRGLGFSECFAPNTMLLVLEIFRANLFLATHSEINCSSLLIVAVISVTVVADVYSVESSAHWPYSLVKFFLFLSKWPRQLLDSSLIMLERLPLKKTLCVLLRQVILVSQYSRRWV